MWSGGPIPGLPIKPAAVPAGAAAPVPAPATVQPAAEPNKRRTATADIGVASTIVPPAPDEMPSKPRAPQKTVIGSGISAPIPGVASAAAPEPADVDVSMDKESDAAAESPSAPPVVAESSAAASPVTGAEPSGPREAGEPVPQWAEPAPSAGTEANASGSPGQGRNKLMLAGIAGGALLIVAVLAAVLMGGKSPAKPQAAAPKPVPAVEAPKPVPSPAVANPEPAAAEPAKAPAAAEAKAEAHAPAKAAVPAEKPVAEKGKPEKKPAAEKPAVAERPAKPTPAPVAEKPKAASEPAPVKAEKKAPEMAAPSAGEKIQLAAEAYQRGNAKLLNGALPEAIAAFSEAIKLNPKDPQSQRGLGLAYAQSGKAPMAVRHLKLYLKAAPGAPDRALIEKRIAQLSGR
jgi:hypothetical protein